MEGGPSTMVFFSPRILEIRTEMEWMPWVIAPLVGAIIGYVTNTIAIAMLFRPHHPKKLGWLRLQGLIPKRQPDIARKIGEVVGNHLLDHKDLVSAFENMDIEEILSDLLSKGLGEKISEFQAMPLIGAFLTPERVEGLKEGIVRSILKRRSSLFQAIEDQLEKNLDVSGIVEAKVAAFPSQELEALILAVAKRELRAIEIWGAILGAFIGFLQAGLLQVLR
jgi:uncharacterized membrane protein YheB (UPF0754 family)